MIQAADDAVDAGVVMVFANGNAGPDTATVNSPAIAPKVIGVGAVTKDAALFPGSVSVTAPEPVPANLKNFQIGGAAFGPTATSVVGPAPLIPGERVSTAATDKSLGCSLTGDVSPFPAGSLTGSIALIERGVCNFSEKVYNAQRGGAIAAIIYNARRERRHRRNDGRRRTCGRRDDPVMGDRPHQRSEHAQLGERQPDDGTGEVRSRRRRCNPTRVT